MYGAPAMLKRTEETTHAPASSPPLDHAAIEAATERGPILTIEEHTVFGGLGSAVAEVVVTTRPTRMKLLGVPGVFAPTGSAAFLLEHFELTPPHIRNAARALLRETERDDTMRARLVAGRIDDGS